MPYIPEKDRKMLNKYILLLGHTMPDTTGCFNYVISMLCEQYIKNKGLSYTSLNDLIGVLECVKQELYRRIAAPYEDIKCTENGDVFDLAGMSSTIKQTQESKEV